MNGSKRDLWTEGEAPQGPCPGRARPCPGLAVYRRPEAGGVYVMGVDPAEGNPRSDESAAQVLDAQTGEQVALLVGQGRADHLCRLLH